MTCLRDAYGVEPHIWHKLPHVVERGRTVQKRTVGHTNEFKGRRDPACSSSALLLNVDTTILSIS